MWRVADELMVLKRSGQHILFNAAQVDPAFIPRGGHLAMRALRKLGRDVFDKADAETAGLPAGLFDFLTAHNVIEPAGVPLKPPEPMCRECLHPRKSLYLLLTQSCNQACIYCYNGRETYQTRQHRMMSFETAILAVRTALKTLTPDGTLEIVLFGGEPLLNWPLAKQIIEFCQGAAFRDSERKIVFHFTTNLTLLPQELILLAQKRPISFLVDIDGPPEIHNKVRPLRNNRPSLARTIRNLNRLKDAGIDVSLRTTVASWNQDMIPEITAFHKEIGGASSAFVPINAVDSDGVVFPETWCPDPRRVADGLCRAFETGIWPVEKLFPFNEINRRLFPGSTNRFGCGAPLGNTPVVSVDGGIYSCIYLVNNKAHEVGQLHANDFPRQDVLERMRKQVDIHNRKRCAACGWRNLCGGGCPVGILGIKNNAKAPDSVKRYTREMACAVSKTVLEHLMWHKSKQIEHHHSNTGAST